MNPGGMRVPFYRASVGAEEAAAAGEALRSGWLTTAGRTAEFETRFRAWVGGRAAVATNSATAALHLALLLEGIGPGDEVIAPAVTFCSTANVVAHVGADLVLADVDPESGLLTSATVRSALSSKTRAILPVHLHGAIVDPAGLDLPAGLAVIEDCAHAFPASILSAAGRPERPAGTLGSSAAFSFYATKNITTGEGGMLVLGDARKEARARSLLLHGMSSDAWRRYEGTGNRYRVVEPGYKYNLSDPAAAVGLVQLGRIGELQANREALWRRYAAAFADLANGIRPPVEPGEIRHARHLFALRVAGGAARRDALAAHLAARGVATSLHFGALHREPAYAALRERGRARWGDLPGAEAFADASLSIPFWPDLSESEAAYVADAITSYSA